MNRPACATSCTPYEALRLRLIQDSRRLLTTYRSVEGLWARRELFSFEAGLLRLAAMGIGTPVEVTATRGSVPIGRLADWQMVGQGLLPCGRFLANIAVFRKKIRNV
ncbi:MAG: hypothetical protein ACYTAO_04945 [Planctomycetota bacterium]